MRDGNKQSMENADGKTCKVREPETCKAGRRGVHTGETAASYDRDRTYAQMQESENGEAERRGPERDAECAKTKHGESMVRTIDRNKQNEMKWKKSKDSGVNAHKLNS